MSQNKNDGGSSQPAANSGCTPNEARRLFLKQSSAIVALALTPPAVTKAAALDEKIVAAFEKIKVTLEVNGTRHKIAVEPRVTLLDLLREDLKLTGTKKGCDYGQCGACTVHVNGQRVLSCLTLAVMQDGNKISTIEGLADGEKLHPLQEAFIKHDGLQCGYCTPGQLMSAVTCIREGKAGSEAEVREYMSGNICRCGAYPNIVNAILAVKNEGQKI
jgi:xanthine dehydrogenase YagT iron-sulfur-binding subunit